MYRGHKAYRLFLQSYQFLLWKQCRALTQEKGFPEELWVGVIFPGKYHRCPNFIQVIVRDLWTLRLSELIPRLDPPDGHDSEGSSLGPRLESSTESDPDVSRSTGRIEKKASKSPLLVETVSLCCLGILILRLPLSLSDIYR